MNPPPNPIWSLVTTFGLMSLFAVGGANAAIPEMHRIAVEVHHWMTDKEFAETRVKRGEDHHHDHRRPDQPAEGGDPADNPAKARAEHHRQVDDVRPWQEMAKRVGLVELLRRHPTVLFDQAAPGKGQHATEPRKRHFGKRQKQRDHANGPMRTFASRLGWHFCECSHQGTISKL